MAHMLNTKQPNQSPTSSLKVQVTLREEQQQLAAAKARSSDRDFLFN